MRVVSHNELIGLKAKLNSKLSKTTIYYAAGTYLRADRNYLLKGHRDFKVKGRNIATSKLNKYYERVDRNDSIILKLKRA